MVLSFVEPNGIFALFVANTTIDPSHTMFFLYITKYMKQMTKTPTTIFQNNDEAIEILGYFNPITINID